jgi:UDP:flavonoid glycosyltransferase YjiC (YdhE family)
MPETISPVFATMSQALPVVEQFGYPVEFLTPHIYAGVDSVAWDGWLRDEMDEIIDFHRAAAVVFDGNYPYQGVVLSAATRPDCRLVWIRRGMWRNQELDRRFLERQRFFDLVIEPGDVAEQYDNGLTTKQRDGVLSVDPIRLLDEEELLSREAAAAELCLDTTRPAVLLQLGSGSNRDIIQIMDHLVSVLKKHPSVQIVNAEWLITNTSIDLWPGVLRLRGHPITRYYKAFDFTIAAAGYNSFNEIISFGLPAIFIPNGHESMDDQIGRARCAQDNGAAFYLSEQQIGEAETCIGALMDEEARAVLRVNCRRIARSNGATTAAETITAMIR